LSFEGVVVPLITPFSKDLSIDFGATKWLIEELGRAGVDAVFSSSTTGEFPHLTLEEMKNLNEFVSRERPSGLRVFAGVTANSAHHAAELAKHAADAGADAAVSTTPYYFKHGRDALKRYFSMIVESADIPLILYTIPSTTGILLPIDLVVELAQEYSQVVGIKVTHDSLWYLARLVDEVKSVRRDFSVFTGSSYLMLPALEVGADGGVVALANAYPATLVELYRAWRRGDLGKALELHRRALNLSKLYELHSHIGATLKTLLNAAGAPIEPVVRPPLTTPRRELIEEFLRGHPVEIGVR